jgi:hypothetical protein
MIGLFILVVLPKETKASNAIVAVASIMPTKLCHCKHSCEPNAMTATVALLTLASLGNAATN